MVVENWHAEWRFDMLSIARWCAAQGWPVLPLAAGRKTPVANCPQCQGSGHTHVNCPCIAAGRWCHGFHAATTDRDRIDVWWSSNPHFGVGVACGPAGLVVLDVDAHAKSLPSRDKILPGIAIHEEVDLEGLKHGFHSLALLAALRGQPDPAADEEALKVRTPSGGLHIWYRADDKRRFRCSTGSSSGRALAWQVDVRADGGYIVAPGTTTNAGTYMPVGSMRMPRRLPEWLAVELTRTRHLDVPQQRSTPGCRHCRNAPGRRLLQQAEAAAAPPRSWSRRFVRWSPVRRSPKGRDSPTSSTAPHTPPADWLPAAMPPLPTWSAS